jgi:hypothetical protein
VPGRIGPGLIVLGPGGPFGILYPQLSTPFPSPVMVNLKRLVNCTTDEFREVAGT